ncbi:hypothetical protein [Parageobacillus sp. G301]|uniref:hypothetical protein n=1 Tax=Parageobacillus sp. G301 TaxID=2998290 RepID=UPI00255454C2|nr:hypothetical protein [Parageobacillus sp. G301]
MGRPHCQLNARLIFVSEKRRYGNDDRLFCNRFQKGELRIQQPLPGGFVRSPPTFAGKEVVMREVKPISSKKVSGRDSRKKLSD